MSSGQMSGVYSNAKISRGHSLGSIRPVSKRRAKQKEQAMKLSFRKRLRNWLMKDDYESDIAEQVIRVDEDRLSSEGMRLQVYKASGGYVVETRTYDYKTDRHHNTMHVITDEDDLGDRIGKIIMMEALRG